MNKTIPKFKAGDLVGVINGSKYLVLRIHENDVKNDDQFDLLSLALFKIFKKQYLTVDWKIFGQHEEY